MSARVEPSLAGHYHAVPLALDPVVDQDWIKQIARIGATTPDHATRAPNERRTWIKRDAPCAQLAENPTLACAFQLAWPETDQYMDPWRDVSLSLMPHTRDRHSYAWNNPVGNTDPDGHDCSSGSGVSGGAACADARNNYCERNPSSMYCGGAPAKAADVERNDRQVIAATGGGSSYLAPGGPNVADRIVSTPVRGPSILSLKNPITNFMIGEQAAFIQDPSLSGFGMAAATMFKPVKAGDNVWDAWRGADNLDTAKDAKRATSGAARSASVGVPIFGSGSVRGRSMISMRRELMDAGYAQRKARGTGYLLEGPNGETVRFMRRNGGWDLRAQNQYGNYLDEFGNVAPNANAAHGIGIRP